jgi:hypothetical protein
MARMVVLEQRDFSDRRVDHYRYHRNYVDPFLSERGFLSESRTKSDIKYRHGECREAYLGYSYGGGGRQMQAELLDDWVIAWIPGEAHTECDPTRLIDEAWGTEERRAAWKHAGTVSDRGDPLLIRYYPERWSW